MPDPPRQAEPPSLPYLRHLPYLGLFAALTLVFTRPLAASLTSAVIGGPGDNLSFVWNFWWAKTAVATHQSIFWTPALFAPIGTSLATHSYVPLMSVGAAAAFPSASPLALYNASLLLSMFLNFVCAYAAAHTIVRDRAAAAFAAVVFGAAPFLGIRLEGHLSVLSAWGLPLVFWLTMRWLRGPATPRAVLLAIALAAVAYTDYYYFIFGLVEAAFIVAFHTWTLDVSAQPLTLRRRRALFAAVSILAVVAVAIAAIAATGGADTAIAGIRLRMTDTFNARVIAGFLAVVSLAIWKWPSVRVSSVRPLPDGCIPQLLRATVVLAVLLFPLFVASYAVWYAGDYSSQAYVWRNAPPGIDLATLFLGNQLHPLTGGWTAGTYRHFGINGIESAAWLGVVPTILIVVAWRLRAEPTIRTLYCLGGFFLVWSLGPYLRVLNYNTGLMLPQTAARFVPLLANARIPGRAFAVVQLSAALLGACALASMRDGGRRLAHAYAWIAIAGVLLDFMPSPRQMTALDVPSIYARLKDLPAGNVLEVPFGLRDGFGEHGALDHRVLFYQTVHEHPEMGGFVARLSRNTLARFESDPITGPILRLSAGEASPGMPGECASSLVCRTRYVVIDRSAASTALQDFVAGAFALRPIGEDGGRALFEVEHVPACACR